MSVHTRLSQNKVFLWAVVGLLFAGLLAVWLVLTPAGWLGKLQAIGYAVCHQDAEHTLSLGGRLLPLCSRCTGMYLGTLVAMTYLLGRRRASRFPSGGKIAVLAVLALAFALDGVNSTVAVLWPAHVLYAPSNTLRLFSGLGMGVVIANVLLPLWHQTFWAESSAAPLLNSWGQLAGLIGLETLVGVLVLTGTGWLYFPVAVLATGMVPVLLAMVYTLLGLVVSKRENLYRYWHEGILAITGGAFLALLQIGAFDWLRYVLTGTWQGFHF